ncbi:GNAT family N-acetyltransferase [Paenibacillus sp. MER TA 81-3]|uniref:GNAT family N-acetyltransferase n=1 Tax=Paenibacillus sp. MER TA 81-3 TaxID=2939573 RepID=UPI00203F9C92|nr:GNAT family N-acetyltransferase [Paenibacillus sp. MER TA 81-3]MCM3338479.1 GNAT family N-acetyltransferase [Paenibacillus sp. MER TA 81-3]
MITIREFRPPDVQQMVELFYDTVHTVNARDYSKAQLEAWAPRAEQEARAGQWLSSFRDRFAYVAECGGDIVGFGDMTTEGYLDRLYVHKDYQGQGVASALVAALERDAGSAGIRMAHTDASLTARPFFEKHGYAVIRTQSVERKGVMLTNIRMEKELQGDYVPE